MFIYTLSNHLIHTIHIDKNAIHKTTKTHTHFFQRSQIYAHIIHLFIPESRNVVTEPKHKSPITKTRNWGNISSDSNEQSKKQPFVTWVRSISEKVPPISTRDSSGRSVDYQ